jgi:hypothetical protein
MAMLKTKAPLPILGLNVASPGEFIDPRQAPNCQNMEINRQILRKRWGTQAMGASMGERIMDFGALQIGEVVKLLRVGLTKTELWDDVAAAWTDVAGASWTGTEDDIFDFAFPLIGGAKIMAITNGVDPIMKYTGSGNTAALGGTPPKARFMLDYNGYLLLLYIIDGGVTYSGRIQWPDTGDPENWTPGVGSNAGSVDLVDDGKDITGADWFGQYVAVHKESAIYLGYLTQGSGIFQFDRKATGIGTCARETIQNLPDGTQIFLARDGLHLFNGITAPLIPSPIMDEIRETLNPANAFKSKSILVREKDEYWVFMPIGSDTEPQTCYKYNYRLGYAWKDVRANLTAVSSYFKTDDPTWDEDVGTWDAATDRWDDVINLALNPIPVFGDTVGNVTQRNNGATDAGAAIDAFWDSKDFTCQDLGVDEDGRLVRWMEMQVWAKGNSVQMFYSTDGGNTWTESSGSPMTLASDYPSDDAPDYFYFDVLSSRIRFRFRNSNDAESFTIKNFVVKAVPREMRR